MSKFTDAISQYHEESSNGKLFVGKSMHDILRTLAELHYKEVTALKVENAIEEVRTKNNLTTADQRNDEYEDMLAALQDKISDLGDQLRRQKTLTKTLQAKVASQYGLANGKTLK